MNVKAVLLVLLLALVVIFALVCVLLTRGEAHTHCGYQARYTFPEHLHSERRWLFADLSQDEISHVVQYLKTSLGLVLEDASRANPSDNCIYSIDLQLPPKAESLSYLDHGGSRPPRQALVVVYFGNQPHPNVTEFVVGPLPEPTYHRDVTVEKYGGQVPYYRRAPLLAEYKQMNIFLHHAVFPKAPSFMKEVLDYDGTNVAAMTTSPRGLKSGDRATWIVLFQNVTGYFLHPIGLEVMLDHSHLNSSQWNVKNVFYNGQYYRDFTQLEREFTEGRVTVEKVKKVPADGDISSMKPKADHAEQGPLNFESSEPRYHVRNNQIRSLSWNFAFRIDVSRGPRLFDIRFKGQRVIYELSVQDAMSVYGSSNPGGMLTRYMDASFGIGKYMYSLMRGVDCPYSATYLDVSLFSEAEKPRVTKDAICVFEQDLGSPIRRHYSKFNSIYYGGLPGTALVFRSVSTVGNYDYLWDFVFYPNGAIESKIHATGYISSSFLYGSGLDYGNKVGDHTLGTIHTHFFAFKVDLDVGDSFSCNFYFNHFLGLYGFCSTLSLDAGSTLLTVFFSIDHPAFSPTVIGTLQSTNLGPTIGIGNAFSVNHSHFGTDSPSHRSAMLSLVPTSASTTPPLIPKKKRHKLSVFPSSSSVRSADPVALNHHSVQLSTSTHPSPVSMLLPLLPKFSLKFDGSQWLLQWDSASHISRTQTTSSPDTDLASSSGSEGEAEGDSACYVTIPDSDVEECSPPSSSEAMQNYSDFVLRMAKSINLPMHHPKPCHTITCSVKYRPRMLLLCTSPCSHLFFSNGRGIFQKDFSTICLQEK
ncbi:hypothetical protein JRQ81_004768 [Phrynocephalus forsythii]|uniref:Amine oxidase n=1 Tax=Phrynocephalus forsythii TaxID=171643 RepID=A0A9Q0XFM9_9SAUR|nr:hypothetical protein JRQ81_004768 [Phrynocephalus forsythii]